MFIRTGYHIDIELPAPTTIQTILDIHPSRARDVVSEHHEVTPTLAEERFHDSFDNISRVVHAPAGLVSLKGEALVYDHGWFEAYDLTSPAADVTSLPSTVLQYLRPSRYCEVDELGGLAWSRFGHLKGGHERVQAVCSYVHQALKFDYARADATRTAVKALAAGTGVCRDFAHTAVALVRCLNIPARYATGYLGDIGVPKDPAPMDFSAWFEAYIGGRWYAYDARHNTPRIGRIVLGYGRDATDVAMLTTFGAHVLKRFEVIADEAEAPRRTSAAALKRRLLQFPRPVFAARSWASRMSSGGS